MPRIEDRGDRARVRRHAFVFLVRDEDGHRSSPPGELDAQTMLHIADECRQVVASVREGHLTRCRDFSTDGSLHRFRFRRTAHGSGVGHV